MVKARGFPSGKIGAFRLPAGFLYAGNLTFVSKLAEADTADAEFAKVTVRSAANFASCVFSCGEFLRFLLFELH